MKVLGGVIEPSGGVIRIRSGLRRDECVKREMQTHSTHFLLVTTVH
jgi:hypothetical protein